ncbi:MAG: phospho-sugar mutase [Verrucomicrobia bacterium]|nr:phospho-sugar mutase [Verrucomicrobiota bacterium]MBS0637655.1 phospho-sugar mutase [Verrucomicrobiota bacterium]
MNTTALQKLSPDIQQRVRYWLEKNFDDETKQEINGLLEKDPEALVDAFYTSLSFGTGGMRGLMGVGSNRMNVYTVRWATQGLANYLVKAGFSDAAVAIGYDSRHNSKHFAHEAARVLAGNGMTVYIFSELRPTPLVSFACRYHKCQAAIMVTASHNPPQYNGYKVYWSDGAQVLPPHDTGIMAEVKLLNDPDQVKLAPLSSPLIHLMGKEVDEAYLEAITPLQLWPELSKDKGSSLKILYSSLHGTGITMVPEALKRFGFTNVDFVDPQVIPDGDFPTCKKPNPEEKAALQLGIDKLLKEGHDIFIATDPDCDRLGVVVRTKHGATALTGNQIISIAAEYVCQARSLPNKAAFVKTIVTSELFRHVVESHKATCFDVLTGFKYIAEKIRQWESTPGSYNFVFGGEESYGCLLGTVVRDKDAVISSCLLSEIALYAKEQNKTLLDLLDDMFMRYGVFVEDLISVEFEETKEGKELMQSGMNALRTNEPKTILNHAVVKCSDLLKPSDLPKSDVLIFELDDGSKVVIRPSGTEPRIKIYIFTKEAPSKDLEASKQAASSKAKALATAFKSLFAI